MKGDTFIERCKHRASIDHRAGSGLNTHSAGWRNGLFRLPSGCDVTIQSDPLPFNQTHSPFNQTISNYYPVHSQL